MPNTFNNQLNEIIKNLDDMLDFMSVRYIIKVEQNECVMGQIILDYIDDRQVPDDLDLAALVKSLYYGEIYVTYDLYEIARDDTGEPALVKYLHDVYLDTTTTAKEQTKGDKHMEHNTKNYIGRKFSLQAFKETCTVSEPIPGWAIRCDGAPVYIDEWGDMQMDAVLPNEFGNMITGYGCSELWTVKE